jgi:hypothetical protein
MVGSPYRQTLGTALVTNWPEWWDWEIELSPHLLKRMIDRGFNESDVRTMMAHALRLREDAVPGRWVVEAKLDARAWQVIVEPDTIDKLVVVITAFPAERQ